MQEILKSTLKILNAPNKNKDLLYLQQLAFVRVGWFDVPFGQFINLSPEVSVLLPHFLQLCLSLGGRAAGFETQPGDDGLLSTFWCHGCCVSVDEVTLDLCGERGHFTDCGFQFGWVHLDNKWSNWGLKLKTINPYETSQKKYKNIGIQACCSITDEKINTFVFPVIVNELTILLFLASFILVFRGNLTLIQNEYYYKYSSFRKLTVTERYIHPCTCF